MYARHKAQFRQSSGFVSSGIATTVATLLAAIVFGFAPLSPVAANDQLECYSEDMDKRITACSSLIARPNLSPFDKSSAYSSRALAYSHKRAYDRAIADYNHALNLVPNAPGALNNRAWAYYKSGKPELGRPDVERALSIDPESGPALDTRAHILQAAGNSSAALADYNNAMIAGGAQMTILYQCGLSDQGLYRGPRDGKPNAELRAALSICVTNPRCDPLPADEYCRPASS